MAFDDVLGEALDAADNHATISYDDPDSVTDFVRDFTELMTDEDGNVRDEFPSADEIPLEERQEWYDFLDEYDLWDAFRDEWEDYEKAA